MAGPYKTTIIFESETGQGWSETWYNNGAGSLSLAGIDADDLCTARVNLIGQGNSIPTWKVVDTTQPRFSLTRDGTNAPFVPNKFPTDNPVSSQLGICTCAPFTGRRQFWMRGIPDDWVVFDPTVGHYVIVGAFLLNFQAFAAFIRNGKWCLRVADPIVTAAQKAPVGAVSPATVTGYAKLTLGGASTLVGDKNIIVGGFRYPLQHLNGTYLYPNGFAFDGASVTLANRYVQTQQALTYVSGAWIRNQAFQYRQITNVAYDRPGDRKVGRVFGVPRGRRSSR